MTVPLYIFEARYRKLVRYCQEENIDQFIISLARQKRFSEDTMPFYAFGTLVRILELSENADGTFHLLGHGQERCQIKIEHSETIAETDGSQKPLFYSEKLPLPLLRSDPNQERIAAWDSLDVFRSYAKTFFAFEALKKIDEVLPEDLIYQASFICANIRVPAEDRQRLLETDSLTLRFQLAQTLMEQHIAAYIPPKNL